jgi:transposase
MREDIAMARAARRPGDRQHRPRRSRQAHAAPFRQRHLHAAGIDVGAACHPVAVPRERDAQPVQCFGAGTAALYALAEWRQQCQIDTGVMASTGVDWIPLFEVLEARGFDVKLGDAHAARQVPGRTTDVQDCQWLQELHTSG